MKQIDLIDWDRIRVFRYGENRRFESTEGFAPQIRYGYRCPAHNVKVGGVKQSAHMAGLAADISCPDSVTRLKILRGLIVAGFRRIGIGKNFIHCDVDASKPNNVWLYGDR